MIGFSDILVFAQATAPGLVERWFNTDTGMLGMSLTLNVVLLYVCWYLLKLSIRKDAEKSKALEDSMHETKVIYDQIFENTLEVTKAITELSTIIKGNFGKS